MRYPCSPHFCAGLQPADPGQDCMRYPCCSVLRTCSARHQLTAQLSGLPRRGAALPRSCCSNRLISHSHETKLYRSSEININSLGRKIRLYWTLCSRVVVVVVGVSQGVSVCLRVSQGVSGCLNVSQGVSGCIIVSQCVSRCIRVSHCVSGCLMVSRQVGKKMLYLTLGICKIESTDRQTSEI